MVPLPGGNGGMHRGPDRFPRRQVVRALVLRALTEAQERLIRVDGKSRRQRRPVEGAMLLDVVARLQRIAKSGSDTSFLRMLEGMHTILQPERDETGTGAGVTPMPARFVYATDAGETPADEATEAEPGVVLGPGGKPYVEVRE